MCLSVHVLCVQSVIAGAHAQTFRRHTHAMKQFCQVVVAAAAVVVVVWWVRVAAC